MDPYTGRVFCSGDGTNLNEYEIAYCFGSAYVYNVLVLGYGFPAQGPSRVTFAGTSAQAVNAAPP